MVLPLHRRLSGSTPAWTILSIVTTVTTMMAVPRIGTAQPPCNKSCDPSKRDTQGCCPAIPVQPSQPSQPLPGPGPSVGRKCATSQECPGQQVCIQYKCQIPPSTPPPPPPPPPPPLGGPTAPGRWWIGIAWNAAGDWAARSGTSLAEANAAAVGACNQVVGKNDCIASDHPVAGDKLRCISIYRNGPALRSQEDPNLQNAKAAALAACNAVPPGQGPGCYEQLSVCNDRPVSAPSIWAYVGIGWNNTGFWATRTATSGPEAQALALLACSKGGTGCYNAPNPVPGEKLECFAIYYDGKNLFSKWDPDLTTASAGALKACTDGHGPQPCKSQIQACNNRR